MGFRNIVSGRIVSLQMEIDSLKNEVADLKEMVEMPQEKPVLQEGPKPWKPENGEMYYTITCGTITGGDFYASSYVYNGDSVDRSCIICRNCFPTEEHAEQVAEKMRFLLRLEQLHDMICPDYVPDYGDDETKYHIYFSHLQGKYNISCSTSWENPCMVAFDTKENALKATEILNKELEESK